MSFLKKTDSVEFDPSKPEHRKAVRSFMKRLAWADSPLKFKHDPAYGSVSTQVQIKLLQWYLEQEETKEKKKEARKIEKLATSAANVKFIRSLGTAKTKPPVGDKELAFAMMGISSEFKK